LVNGDRHPRQAPRLPQVVSQLGEPHVELPKLNGPHGVVSGETGHLPPQPHQLLFHRPKALHLLRRLPLPGPRHPEEPSQEGHEHAEKAANGGRDDAVFD